MFEMACSVFLCVLSDVFCARFDMEGGGERGREECRRRHYFRGSYIWVTGTVGEPMKGTIAAAEINIYLTRSTSLEYRSLY